MQRQDKNTVKASKALSYFLRHNPKAGGLTLDGNGWAVVEPALAAISQRIRAPFTREMLDKLVAECPKQRFAFNEDGTKIRANQGHSIEVDLEFEPADPPDVLYHGTARRFMDSIQKEGLQKMNRQYVHLSVDVGTATNVGKRHGSPTVLKIDAKKMKEDGIVFYVSKNGVWLTDHVDPQYFTEYH